MREHEVEEQGKRTASPQEEASGDKVQQPARPAGHKKISELSLAELDWTIDRLRAQGRHVPAAVTFERVRRWNAAQTGTDGDAEIGTAVGRRKEVVRSHAKRIGVRADIAGVRVELVLYGICVADLREDPSIMSRVQQGSRHVYWDTARDLDSGWRDGKWV